MPKPTAKRMRWSAVRSAREAEHGRHARIHEAERRVIEAAKEWRRSIVDTGAEVGLAEAVRMLEETERA